VTVFHFSVRQYSDFIFKILKHGTKVAASQMPKVATSQVG